MAGKSATEEQIACEHLEGFDFVASSVNYKNEPDKPPSAYSIKFSLKCKTCGERMMFTGPTRGGIEAALEEARGDNPHLQHFKKWPFWPAQATVSEDGFELEVGIGPEHMMVKDDCEGCGAAMWRYYFMARKPRQ